MAGFACRVGLLVKSRQFSRSDEFFDRILRRGSAAQPGSERDADDGRLHRPNKDGQQRHG